MAADDRRGRAARTVRRALALRCPRCGQTALFPAASPGRGAAWRSRWFGMARQCSWCGLTFERAPGYFIGAIYINYGVSSLIALAGAFALWAWAGVPMTWQLLIWLPFLVVFPLWFFRWSRSFWLAIEYSVNPDD